MKFLILNTEFPNIKVHKFIIPLSTDTSAQSSSKVEAGAVKAVY